MRVSEVLTVPEAAAYLRVHEQTVYELLREGRLRGVKVGRSWRIHRTTLEAFIKGAPQHHLGEEAPMKVELIRQLPAVDTTMRFTFSVDDALFQAGITHPALIAFSPPAGNASREMIEDIVRAKIQLDTLHNGTRPHSGLVVRTEDVPAIKAHLGLA
jgi:excisionase family DNA binding protein